MFEVNVSDDGKVELSGVEGKFLNLISSILKFKYYLASPPYRDWGRIDENGNWTGLMGMVHRKEVDFALSTLTITEDRMEAVHFTTPYTIEDVTFLVEKPGLVYNGINIFQPFDFFTWICVLMVLIFSPGICWVFLNLKHSYIKLFFNFFGFLLRQPVSINTNSVKTKLLFSPWCFFTLVVSCIYSSIIFSYMTLPLHQKGIHNFRELSEAVKRGSYRCLAEKGTTITKYMISDDAEYLKFLGESIENNKWFFYMSDAGIRDINTRNTAILNVHFKLEMIIGLKGVADSFQISKDVFASWKLALAVRKDFCCRKKLNKVISRVWNSGLFHKIKSDEWFKLSLSISKSDEVKTMRQKITIKDIQNLLIALCGGYILSSCVCIGEIIYFHIKRVYFND
ncbi:glutamate receptor ionotropic, delta-1 [Trichonephila clavata]|uniref:Glutamate receptor ionotropic, delta-1 n=1 Tax=Trichonephila clavata TaxID=2740835 RepID=A0A8X6IKS8_TRICU|nr:glutamate receptor ionotropic, delta-1 [Trichonephila clavata]